MSWRNRLEKVFDWPNSSDCIIPTQTNKPPKKQSAKILLIYTKEIVKRRHGEPIKFLFLPKMGLLGSQASTEKKIGCELWATFEGCFFMFSWAKI